jgi:hypothetical protein
MGIFLTVKSPVVENKISEADHLAVEKRRLGTLWIPGLLLPPL